MCVVIPQGSCSSLSELWLGLHAVNAHFCQNDQLVVDLRIGVYAYTATVTNKLPYYTIGSSCTPIAIYAAGTVIVAYA